MSLLTMVAPCAAAVTVSLDTTPEFSNNLTAEGTADWFKLGYTTSSTWDEKAGSDFLSTVTRIGNAGNWTGTSYQSTWTDGTFGDMSGTNYKNTWEAQVSGGITAPSLGFDVTGPAGSYSLIVYSTLYQGNQAIKGNGEFTATVSGGGPSDSATLLTATHGSFAVDFDLATGESLNVLYQLTNGGNGNVGISSATLQFTPVPEPSTLILAGLGMGGLMGTRRRRNR